jgi:DNA polymerase family A
VPIAAAPAPDGSAAPAPAAVALAPQPDGSALLCDLAADGARLAPAVRYQDLSSAVADRERSGRVRWVWPSAAWCYPDLLGAGVRVARCHDIALVEALLLGRDGRHGEPATLAAAWARLRGERVPRPVPGVPQATALPVAQQALFERAETEWPEGDTLLDALAAVYADHLVRMATGEAPARLRLLAAAESAGALAAAEMGFDGLPWRPDVHDELLAGLLGPRPARGERPRRLAGLADQITAAFGGRPVNPDSPSQLVRAFAADGVSVSSTRSEVLRGIDHPAVPLLLQYKELARLHAAHGWAWLDSWVTGGRFRAEYVVGGVVSGRWATNGGGALQIPRVLRRAVVADPGWTLVVADAAQLEPRVLAALAGDRAFAQAAAAGDLYAELAGAFGGDRAKAKVALLSAMYGGAGGEAGQLLAVLRRRFPDAAGYVEAAARAGEEGRVVRSVLGRTCPPPSAAWRSATASATGPGAARAVRARGRFTRNFVVQASAADWALVLIACLRPRLAALGAPAGPGGPGRAHLVFFQHDEVIVHCREELAEPVVAAIASAAREAGRLVFGSTPVRFPVTTAVVNCYADAKQGGGP